MIEFFEPCVPPTTTAQQKRVNHSTGVFFKDKKAQQAIGVYAEILRRHVPPEPLSGPLKVTIEVTWPWLASHLSTKAKRAECERLGKLPHTSRPDSDNVAKQLIDEMARWLLIEKDERIADLTVRKWWGAKPGISVTVKRWDEE